jgi:hypothetical protein
MSFYEVLPWLMMADAAALGCVLQGMWIQHTARPINFELPE